jgi:hypothetical protein
VKCRGKTFVRSIFLSNNDCFKNSQEVTIDGLDLPANLRHLFGSHTS